ncbi:hypothetical protein DPMN_073783 [Dreissena polymorpha]|uniref:Uncharacterized protein n=1 Tax=Dreissena polymorpha TaxID=45954 RepID=A0A9D4BZS4_DREPO|nr:hypothetical protein DPMN_073783 [Dreissena polymorpha]
MQFNPSDCETNYFTKYGIQSRGPTSFTATNSPMSQSSGKYLGVTLHEKLLWNSHADEVSKMPITPIPS